MRVKIRAKVRVRSTWAVYGPWQTTGWESAPSNISISRQRAPPKEGQRISYTDPYTDPYRDGPWRMAHSKTVAVTSHAI